MTPMQSLFLNLKNNYLYKLVKLETNLDTRKENYGVEFAEAHRVGDGKPLSIPSQILRDRYEMLTEEECQELWQYLADNKNPKNLPIKYKQGVFDYGHESEVWKPKLSDELVSAFEHLVEQNTVSLPIGILMNPSEQDSLTKVIASENVKNSIKQGLAKIQFQSFLNNTWNLKSVDSQSSKSILNFYGPPGTGKTLSAKGVAHSLNQKLLQVDYSQVESKWVGETGKNIQKVFKLAQEHNAVILFDEADSLVSKRSQDGSQPNYVNENRNIFMQEMDRFQGVVILTTNLFQNYDEALLRRVSQHIMFELPTQEQKISLYKNHIPAEVNLDLVDFESISQKSVNFSGGDIKNVTQEAMVQACVEAHEAGDVTKAKLTQIHLENEIEKIRKSKNTHNGTKKAIGIGNG